jgi:HAE1 family hydrophobic/amphiphilic exporter-1
MNTLSTLVGSNYEISFIKYVNYKVIVQASPEYRALEDILKLYVKMTEMKWSLILLS